MGICCIIIKNQETMENIFSKLEQLSNYKDQLKLWCRFNGLKISFTVSVSFARAKSIHKKIQFIQTKSVPNPRIRWVENELKLFHFCLIALSAVNKIKISQFNSDIWETLLQAFPNKQVELLQFEAACFIMEKNNMKKKWDVQEDQMLAQLVSQGQGELKWNDIAIGLFMRSDKKFFRLGKHCRERWLNHLDNSISHQKWAQDEDEKLIFNVVSFGKKWSRIMKIFDNHRTEHMIKNRFISLVLKYKRNHPYVYDQEEALNGIAKQMGFFQLKDHLDPNCSHSDRSLRNKDKSGENYSQKYQSKNEKMCQSVSSHIEQIQEPQMLVKKEQLRETQNHIIIQGWNQTNQGFPSPFLFNMSPITQFMQCGNLIPQYGNYCQWWLCSLSEFKADQ